MVEFCAFLFIRLARLKTATFHVFMSYTFNVLATKLLKNTELMKIERRTVNTTFRKINSFKEVYKNYKIKC